jgi:alkylation response protein AidB-like acyl-CoA dehydrogenase
LLGAQALLLGGADAQKKAWLPGIAAGEKIVTLAHLEKGSGSAREVTANATGDRFELDGVRAHVLDAHVADAILVTAATSTGGSTLFILVPSQAGVHVTRQRRVDGRNAAIVALDGVSVGSDAVVGERDQASRLLDRVLDRARVGSAAQMLGAAEQAFDDTLAYIKTREQFDVPIGSFQALQHRAVSVFTELALTRSTVLAAARAVDESPEDVPQLASLAKAMASETFMLAAKEAIQMHGGIGVTDEHDIGFYIKRAQADYVSLGIPSQHRQRWAELHGY